jgi:hypothetical protein
LVGGGIAFKNVVKYEGVQRDTAPMPPTENIFLSTVLQVG